MREQKRRERRKRRERKERKSEERRKDRVKAAAHLLLREQGVLDWIQARIVD
jgi:hypothetical protein